MSYNDKTEKHASSKINGEKHLAPENDEYRLIYSQVLDEYIDKKRNAGKKQAKN